MDAQVIEGVDGTLLIVLTKHAPPVAHPVSVPKNAYLHHGAVQLLPRKVAVAVDMWRDGRTAAEMSDALKLSTRKHDTDAGQRLLGAIRMVLPDLLPPRIPPKRRAAR